MSQHARERCAQMGISTKVAKAIYRRRTLTRPGALGRMIATSDEHPRYAVIYAAAEGGRDVIVSVVFRTLHRYVRRGETFDIIDEESA